MMQSRIIISRKKSLISGSLKLRFFSPILKLDHLVFKLSFKWFMVMHLLFFFFVGLETSTVV